MASGWTQECLVWFCSRSDLTPRVSVCLFSRTKTQRWVLDQQKPQAQTVQEKQLRSKKRFVT